jgi:hypothetical protein
MNKSATYSICKCADNSFGKQHRNWTGFRADDEGWTLWRTFQQDRGSRWTAKFQKGEAHGRTQEINVHNLFQPYAFSTVEVFSPKRAVLTIEPYLSNPESNNSKFVVMFTKFCLKYVWNLVGFDSFVLEKSDDHSLIMFHHKRTLNGFWRPGWKDNLLESDTVKPNLIYLTFRRLHTVVIYCHEGQTLYLSAWGWRMYLLTRQCLVENRRISRSLFPKWGYGELWFVMSTIERQTDIETLGKCVPTLAHWPMEFNCSIYVVSKASYRLSFHTDRIHSQQCLLGYMWI